MTYEKQFEHICTMLHEYDLHTGSRGADGVIANPEKWIDCTQFYPFYASAAVMLIEARAKLDAKTTPRTVSAAVGRIIRNTPKHSRIQGVFPYRDKFVVCDGYKLIRLNNDIISLLHCESDFNVDRVMDCHSTDEKIQLPSVAELKAFIAADKAKKGSRNYAPSPYCLDYFVWCNPVYLIDMIQALPGCTAYKPEHSLGAIYFTAENGDGILLPVRPAEKDEHAA